MPYLSIDLGMEHAKDLKPATGNGHIAAKILSSRKVKFWHVGMIDALIPCLLSYNIKSLLLKHTRPYICCQTNTILHVGGSINAGTQNAWFIVENLNLTWMI